MKINNKGGLWQAIKRGVSQRCPSCGKGKMFATYLKQVENCSNCGEKLGHIRAEDGPAWLTILVIGHLLAPFLLDGLPNISLPDWEISLLIIGFTIMLTLWLLPYSKGVFIALIWREGCAGSEK